MGPRFKDKVVIVTGAGCVGPGWGNGRAAAVLFAGEGARVFAVDRAPDTMKETLERIREVGGEATAHYCNVTDNAAVAAMVRACLDQYPGSRRSAARTAKPFHDVAS